MAARMPHSSAVLHQTKSARLRSAGARRPALRVGKECAFGRLMAVNVNQVTLKRCAPTL
jgi:hypothetical protein